MRPAQRQRIKAERRRELGHAALYESRVDDAISHLRKAVALAPECVKGHLNLAHCLLLTGDLPGGFREMEWRFHPEIYKRVIDRPFWEGQPLNGETVVCLFECGYGDTIHFCRFIPEVAARGARVVAMVPPVLHKLLSTLAGVSEVISGEPIRLPQQHYVCPIVRLPHVLGTTLNTIPARPYLHASPALWAGFVGQLSGLKVGLVWAGDSGLTDLKKVSMDELRSIRLMDMAPLLDVPGVSFVSLQLGKPAQQMRDFPYIHDVSNRLKDWADTAGLIAGLDLVISVDTAVCHVTGAIGKPVWMLNRFDTCWRWLQDRTDTPWYPSMRIWRQPAPFDWVSVIAAVKAELIRIAKIGAPYQSMYL